MNHAVFFQDYGSPPLMPSISETLLANLIDELAETIGFVPVFVISQESRQLPYGQERKTGTLFSLGVDSVRTQNERVQSFSVISCDFWNHERGINRQPNEHAARDVDFDGPRIVANADYATFSMISSPRSRGFSTTVAIRTLREVASHYASTILLLTLNNSAALLDLWDQ